MHRPVPPFPPVDTVAAPFGSPAVPHLRRYYGFVRLLAYPSLPPLVSLGCRYSSSRVCSLPGDALISLGTWFDSGWAEPGPSGHPALVAIVRLSLIVSLSAVFFAALIGVPLGALIALTRFRGRDGVIVVLNASI
jgi:ABC-type Fe3+ transport system permease subunit